MADGLLNKQLGLWIRYSEEYGQAHASGLFAKGWMS